MNKAVLFILLVIIIAAAVILVRKNPSAIPLIKTQSGILEIKPNKNEYKASEPVNFTITNGTNKKLYYFPETCASDLVRIFLIQSDQPQLIPGEAKVCQLAPSVSTLNPGQNIKGKISDKVLSKINEGSFFIRFNYSLEKKNQFRLGEFISTDSSSFKITR